VSGIGHSVVASDLDRTLIYSASAAGGTAAVTGALCVEEYDGAPLSYVSRAAAADLTALLEVQRLVPVTTRTVAQYQRIALPGGPARFAVCANGGRLLIGGVEDLDHRSHVTAALARCAPLAEAEAALETWCLAVAGPSETGGPRRREAEGMFCYAVFPHVAPDVAEIDALGAVLAGLGWVVSAQGRKVYCTPRTLSKETALEYLVEVHGLQIWSVAGDSLLDAGMVTAFGGWVPRDSELERRGWVPATAELTDGSGLAAGEQILREFRAVLGV
jgi:hypothetical protein